MKKNMTISRRGFLEGAAVAGGAVAGTRLVGGRLIGEAHAAAPTKSAVVLVYLDGGYNSLFPSAGSFLSNGAFGVNNGNVEDLGNGLVVDKGTFGSMSAFAKTHTAAVGVAHGISAHDAAQRHNLLMGMRSYPLMIANALGGDAAIKHAHVGGGGITDSDAIPPAEGMVTFQRINDMKTTLDAVAGANDPRVPNRFTTAKGLTNSQIMSGGQLGEKARRLSSLREAYPSGIDTLTKPLKVFDRNEFSTAYNLGNNTGVGSFASKMAAAELMVRFGTNAITLRDGGWDSHGDRSGAAVRGKLGGMMGPINTFINRVMDPAQQDQENPRNITMVFIGDFARSLPGSDHQSNVTALVIGNNVKVGTTGMVNANVGLQGGGPKAGELWSFVSKLAKIQTDPTGLNTAAHNALML